MSAIQKVFNNVLALRAVTVLGPVMYARYLASFIAHLANIIHGANLRTVDEAMGLVVEKFRYRGKDVLFDSRYCDEHIRDGSFAFGLAREIYIRDCYFKYHPADVYLNARTVIDLGANRGMFSTLMASTANFVLSVEAQEHFVPVIQHNMQRNKCTNFAIEVCFVGAGGSLGASKLTTLTIPELLNRYNLKHVDLLKMDIEGSEFALFNSPDWLQCVNAISMEVHTAFGDPNMILESLTRYGFSFVMADDNLDRVTDGRLASFIYAQQNIAGKSQ